jgi:hypothetical protein
MEYKQKYFKYKKKYIYLKNQFGGNIRFNTLFKEIIMYCIEYNQRPLTKEEELFGDISFVHIKGGASILYHLINRNSNVNLEGLTEDIDIFFVSLEETANTDIEKFFNGLCNKFPQYTLDIKVDNGLFIISVNGQAMIDITIFYTDKALESNDSLLNLETGMFSYALINLLRKELSPLDYNNFTSGLSEIEILKKTISVYFNNLSNKTGLEKTFTTLELEKFATEKGIANQQLYINASVNWSALANNHLLASQNEALPLDIRNQHLLTYNGYIRQLSPEYMGKIQNKLSRYQQKLQYIHVILGT